MTTIKTPTRIVTISMTGVTSEGYDDGIDYSTDYIGNLVGSDGGSSGLTRCDCETDETCPPHSWHADDETAQWWIDHCEMVESNDNRLSQLSETARAAFDAWAEENGVYNNDVEDTANAIKNHLDAMEEVGSVDIVEVSPSIGEVSPDEYEEQLARLERCYTEVEDETLSKYSVRVRKARQGEADGTYLLTSNGDLQIVGYSVERPDDLRALQDEAYNRFCKGEGAE
jgi:hypothetical protein